MAQLEFITHTKVTWKTLMVFKKKMVSHALCNIDDFG